MIDAEAGKIEITTDGTTPIPSSCLWVGLEYWTQSIRYTETLFIEACVYLAAHKICLRFGEMQHTSNADLDVAQNRGYSNPNRMWKEYRRILKQIRKPIVGGAVKNP